MRKDREQDRARRQLYYGDEFEAQFEEDEPIYTQYGQGEEIEEYYEDEADEEEDICIRPGFGSTRFRTTAKSSK